MKFSVAVCLIFVSIFSAGCPKLQSVSGAPVRTNQPVNSFEDYAFRTLLDTQAGLNKAKEQITNGGLPASLKSDLNRAIVVQDAAVQLLRSYDEAARAGQDVAALQQELASDILADRKSNV